MSSTEWNTLRSRTDTTILAVMQRTLRLITKQPVTVEMDFGTRRTPAYSLLEELKCVVSYQFLPPEGNLADRIRLIMGLLYHEISHIMFTPGNLEANGVLRKILDHCGTMTQAEALKVFNTLEDKRIEALFVRKFLPARHFLATPIYEYYIKNPHPNPKAGWARLAGRPWIDRDLYNAVREAAITVDRKWTEEIDLIVSEYQSFSYRRMRQEPQAVGTLIRRFHALLSQGNVQAPHCQSESDERILEMSHGKGKPRPGKSLPDRHDGPTNPDESITPEDLKKLGDKAAKDDKKGKGGTGKSKAKKPAEGEPDKSMKQMAEEAKTASEEKISERVQDARETVNSIMRTGGDSVGTSSMNALWRTERIPVTSEMKRISRRLTQELDEIRNQASAEHHRGERNGRINQRRALAQSQQASLSLEIFDRFDVGTEDDMSVYVSVLTDMSGSMGAMSSDKTMTTSTKKMHSELKSNRAAKAMWIVEDAFTNVDHTYESYGFDSSFQRFDDKHSGSHYLYREPRGGTQPLSALRDVLVRASHAEAEDRLLVLISDGQYEGAAETYQKLFAEFEAANVYVLGFMIGGSTVKFTRLGVKHAMEIKSPEDMIKPVSDYVKHLMAKHLLRQ